jgi:hypothetical protein
MTPTSSHRRNTISRRDTNMPFFIIGAQYKQIVPAGNSHLEGPLHLVLAFYLREIDIEGIPIAEKFCGIALHGGKFRGFGKELIGLAEIFHPVDLDTPHDGGFANISHRKDHRLSSACPCLKSEGKGPLHRPHLAGEGKLPGYCTACEARQFLLPVGCDHSQCDREIETRALLLDIGGGEVDRGALAGPAVAAVGEGGDHTVFALLHRRVRETHHDDGGLAGAGVDLDFDFGGIDADNGRGKDSRDHLWIGGTHIPRLLPVVNSWN